MEQIPELYVLCDPREPPVRLSSSTSGSCFSAVLPNTLPPQLLIFGLGDWSGLSSEGRVEVKLEGSKAKECKLGTLTSESRCFLWDCGSNNDLGKGELRISMVAFKGPEVKQKRGKRKRVKDKEEENVCPNRGDVKESNPQQKTKKDKAVALVKPFSPAKGNGVIAGSPTGRWGHTLCPMDSETVILIGGQGKGMHFCKDAMWKLATDNIRWSQVDVLSDRSSPEARTGHTAVFDPASRRIYVFGGSKNSKWFNDVHILDTEVWRWRNVEARGKVPPLSYHSCSLFLGELFVFGGVFPRPHPVPDGCSDSLYIFDPQHEIWYQPIVLGEKPCARSGHSACLLHRELYIFGGWDTPVCFNDLYVLDLGLMEFSPVEVKGSSPSPRCWHTAASVSDTHFLIHGGYDGNRALSDTHIFSTVTKTWTSLVHTSLPCSPRAGHSMLPLPLIKGEDGEEEAPRDLLIFGGGDNEETFYSDTVRLPLADLLNQ
ncbi:uncharacterized protein O3C94_021743 [Discoglossus pictus]